MLAHTPFGRYQLDGDHQRHATLTGNDIYLLLVGVGIVRSHCQAGVQQQHALLRPLCSAVNVLTDLLTWATKLVYAPDMQCCGACHLCILLSSRF
jgi:hypothetical protein